MKSYRDFPLFLLKLGDIPCPFKSLFCFADCQFFVVQDDYLNNDFSMSCSNRKLIFEFVISAGGH